MAAGILMFSWTPSSSNGTLNTFFLSVLPGSLVAALGMSIAYIPVLTAAVSNSHKEQTGLASGLVNTSYQTGSALGLAIIIIALTSSQTETLKNISLPSIEALNNSFHLAFIIGGIVSTIAAIIAIVGLKIAKEAKKVSRIS
jgi:hypothetical protein